MRPSPSWWRTARSIALDYAGLLLALGLLAAVFEYYTPSPFLTLRAVRTVANQISVNVILAVGMTFVLAAGGIDLSVGSVLALSAGVLGLLTVVLGWPVWAALPAALCVGPICGAINGLVTVTWRLPAFIVTLGMLEMARGGTYLVTGLNTYSVRGPITFLADAQVLGVSLSVAVALATVIVSQIVLCRTVFGRHVMAVGSNEEVARLSGVGVRRVKVAVYMICGGLVALAATIYVSQSRSASPTAGEFYELQAIAAAVIGGTSLSGGRGSAVRSFLGVVIIAVLGRGLAQLGAGESSKRLITGGVIIAAVVVDHYRQKWSLRRR